MPICQYCGRQLAEGEVCYCRQQNTAPQQGVPYPQNPNQYQNPQNPYPNQYQNPQNPYQNQYQQSPYPNPQQYQNMYQDPNGQPPKKKGMSTGCLVALIIGIILLVIGVPICGVLAAILVPSMMGYMKKSNISSANAAAKTYYNAAQTALVDLDMEDVRLDGTYMISSAGNQDVPFEVSRFESSFRGNVPEDIQGCSYVFVIEDGSCIYSAIEDDGTLGSYPRAVTTTGAYDCNDEFYDFSDLSFDKMVEAAREYVENASSYSYGYDDEYTGDYQFSYN